MTRRPDPVSHRLTWLLRGLSVCMFVIVMTLGVVAVDRHPTSARIDMGLLVLVSFPMMLATFVASEKSRMIKRTWVCGGLAAFTVVAFVLHELFPALGSSS